jgi:hypothetical protein
MTIEVLESTPFNIDHCVVGGRILMNLCITDSISNLHEIGNLSVFKLLRHLEPTKAYFMSSGETCYQEQEENFMESHFGHRIMGGYQGL